MRKVTRYEYEKQLNPELSEADLKEHLTQKGSDYQGLVDRCDEYHRVLDDITEHASKRGLDVRVVDRSQYDDEFVKWSDMIVPVGGDGTFLLAATKVSGRSKPVIGINSDPLRSEGYLCLPKHMSQHHDCAIDSILEGKFKWRWRQRIRLSLSGRYSDQEPVDLHNQELLYPEHRFKEEVKENEIYHSRAAQEEPKPPKTLPILALNEVFIGESLSARVSFYEIGIDGSRRLKQKSSGVTVCTGTGSTSWFFHINNIPKQSVRHILSIAKEVGDCNLNIENELLMRKITKMFNKSLTFDPSEHKMAYVVRDPLVNGIFSVNHPRGFCKNLSLKSRMWDACVVVDGGVSYPFNDGAVVDLSVLEEDALRCVWLDPNTFSHTNS